MRKLPNEKSHRVLIGEILMLARKLLLALEKIAKMCHRQPLHSWSFGTPQSHLMLEDQTKERIEYLLHIFGDS